MHKSIIIMPNLDAPLDNTPYNEEKLAHFKQLLENGHQETKEKIERLRTSLGEVEDSELDDKSAAAHHQGDLASEEDEREKLMIMIGKEEDKMGEINAALDRIDLGTYGICEDTGKKIPEGRLEAIPYTRYGVDASRKHGG
jgi:RNA polymerase-binding protein DksA